VAAEKDLTMLVLAIGTFTDPSKMGPYAEAEMEIAES